LIAVSVNAAWNLVNFRQSLLTALLDAGFRVVAIAPPDGHESALAALGVEFEPIAINGRGMSPTADLKLLRDYVRVLRRLRPRAYLGYTIKPNVYGGMACRLLGIPRIANIAGLGTAFLHRNALNLLVRRLYRVGLGHAERVFFQNSSDHAQFVGEGMVDRRATVVLPGSGIDLTRFTPQLTASADSVTFLLVARLLFAKGIAEYVEAAKALKKRHGHRVAFQILGIRDHSPGGVDAATLDHWQAEGDVAVLDAISDVRPVVSAADCVVLPSYYPEGTPRSLLEAAAMGKAIITTDTPGCRDVVDEGVNGFLCAPRDAVALEKTMERFIQMTPEARCAMGGASRTKAEREFDEAIVIGAYLDAIRALPEPRRSWSNPAWQGQDDVATGRRRRY
jgi:glycosyltransferase involved in cell wall biosynthesis